MLVKVPVKEFVYKKNEFKVQLIIRYFDLEEKWEELPFRGHMSGYLVSNFGNVKKPDGTMAPQYYDQDGYTRFCLYIPKNHPEYKNHKRIAYPYKTHRAVAELFVPNPHPDEFDLVMHLNDQPDCNYYINLMWGTNQMNMDDKKRSGRSRYLRGEEKPDALFNEYQVRQICDLIYNKHITKTSEILEYLKLDGISYAYKESYKNLIHNIKNGHCWKFIRDEYIK